MSHSNETWETLSFAMTKEGRGRGAQNRAVQAKEKADPSTTWPALAFASGGKKPAAPVGMTDRRRAGLPDRIPERSGAGGAGGVNCTGTWGTRRSS